MKEHSGQVKVTLKDSRQHHGLLSVKNATRMQRGHHSKSTSKDSMQSFESHTTLKHQTEMEM